MRTFRLYPEERHFWSFADYGAVLDIVERLQAKRVLEFGPGSSTLALIEGGATTIDTCEDAPDWANVYAERLAAKYPDIVTLHRYVWSQRIAIPAVDARRYDLAFIDGPHNTNKRVPVLAYALERAAAVLMPIDDTKALRQRLEQLAKRGHHVEIQETGPLAGAFALIMREPA